MLGSTAVVGRDEAVVWEIARDIATHAHPRRIVLFSRRPRELWGIMKLPTDDTTQELSAGDLQGCAVIVDCACNIWSGRNGELFSNLICSSRHQQMVLVLVIVGGTLASLPLGARANLDTVVTSSGCKDWIFDDRAYVRSPRRAPDDQPDVLTVLPPSTLRARVRMFLRGTLQGRDNRSPVRLLVPDVLAVITQHVLATPGVSPPGVWSRHGHK